MKSRKVYRFVFIFLILLSFISKIEAKWIGFGSDDPWNKGIIQELGEVNKFKIEKGIDGKPHLLLSFRDPEFHDPAFNYYYLFWDGEKWRGIVEGSPYTHLDFLDGESTVGVELRVDNINNPHVTWLRGLKEWTVQEIAYTHWNGEKWSGLEEGQDETTVLRFDPFSQFYLEVFYEFELDSKNNPHILYYGFPSGETRRSYYIYWNGEEFTTFGDADSGKGLYSKLINDHSYGDHILVLDSNDFPHLSTTFVPAEDYSKMQLYTYWDGEKWTGINGSDEGTWLPYSYHEMYPFYKDDFVFDIDDNPHFVYYADLDGAKKIIYNKWDGSGWSGLKDGEEYTLLDWMPVDDYVDTIRPIIQVDQNKNVHFIAHQLNYDPALLYSCWKDGKWSPISGSDIFPGLKPDGEHNWGLSSILIDFYVDKDDKPIIGANIWRGDELDIASVIKWEEEYDPTVELYFWDREYLLTGDEVKFHCRINNPWEGEFKGNLYIALMDPLGKIYFFPGWGEEMKFTPISLAGGFILPWTEIISFAIPSETPPINSEGMHYFGIFLEDGIKGGFVSYDVKRFRVVRE